MQLSTEYKRVFFKNISSVGMGDIFLLMESIDVFLRLIDCFSTTFLLFDLSKSDFFYSISENPIFEFFIQVSCLPLDGQLSKCVIFSRNQVKQ